MKVIVRKLFEGDKVSRRLPGGGWTIGTCPKDSVEFTFMGQKFLIRIEDMEEILRKQSLMEFEDVLSFDFWRKDAREDG